jgi:hypothetical protein
MEDTTLSYFRTAFNDCWYEDGAKLDLVFEFVKDLIHLETERREKERRIDAIDPYGGEIQP